MGFSPHPFESLMNRLQSRHMNRLMYSTQLGEPVWVSEWCIKLFTVTESQTGGCGLCFSRFPFGTSSLLEWLVRPEAVLVRS